MIDRDRARILASPAPTTRLRLFEELTARAIISDIPGLARRLEVSPQTAYNAIGSLVSLGIARELSGQRRHRVWAYDEYLAILAAGTEPGA